MKTRITTKHWAYAKSPDQHFVKLSKAFVKAQECWLNNQSLHLEDIQGVELGTMTKHQKKLLRILRDYQLAWHELRLWADTYGGKYSKDADYILGKNMQFKL